jgi:hypothetical protein
MRNLIYAGIGSRKTPADMCAVLSRIASQLYDDHWLLRSGHAQGADQAFEIGTNRMQIHLPWAGYNNAAHGYPYLVPKPTIEAQRIAAAHHPNWDNLSDAVKLLMIRNVTIILGVNLESPVQMVVCWTPGGKIQGGTAQGIRVAQSYDIPVFNVAIPEHQAALCNFTREAA